MNTACSARRSPFRQASIWSSSWAENSGTRLTTRPIVSIVEIRVRGLKENMVLGRAGWLHGAAWVIVSVWAHHAYADESRVLVLSESESQSAERAFFPALQ